VTFKRRYIYAQAHAESPGTLFQWHTIGSVLKPGPNVGSSQRKITVKN